MLCDENMSSPWLFLCRNTRGEMLVFIVNLKYKVQHCKRLFEFIRWISWNHRCNYVLYSVVSHGPLAAAQPKMAAGSPTGRLTLTNGLHDYLFIYGLCVWRAVKMFYFAELLQLTVVHYIKNRFSALVIGCYFYFTIITLRPLMMKLRRIYDEVMTS